MALPDSYFSSPNVLLLRYTSLLAGHWTYKVCSLPGAFSLVKPSSKIYSLQIVQGFLGQILQASYLKCHTASLPLALLLPYCIFLPVIYYSLSFHIFYFFTWWFSLSSHVDSKLYESRFLSLLSLHLEKCLPYSKHTLHVWINRWTNGKPEFRLAERMWL